MTQGRKLDTGNPNPGNLGADFGRIFAGNFWDQVLGVPAVSAIVDRKAKLEAMNTWRNAIAHQDWRTVGPNLGIAQVRAWRSACRMLATAFDRAVWAELHATTGNAPW